MGDGLVLTVHPSGRMVWERSTRVGGKLKWLNFGYAGQSDFAKVKEPTEDVIKEHTVKVKNDEYKEKKKLNIDVEADSKDLKFEDVVRIYLTECERLEEATKANYKNKLKPLFGLNGVKWSYLNDALIIKELAKLKDAGKKKETLRGVFENFKTMANWTLLPVIQNKYNFPKIRLFDRISFNKIGFGDTEKSNFKAITDPIEFKIFYKKLKERYERTKQTSTAALILLCHFPKRPNEITRMQWDYINWEKKEIVFPKDYEKIHFPFVPIYPMSNWVVEFLKEYHDFRNSDTHLFMVSQGKPISSSALRMTIRDMGYGHLQDTHGLRASFSTINEYDLEQDHFSIEFTLGHKIKDSHKGAYKRVNGDTKISVRRDLMNNWSNWLEAD